MRPPQIPTKPKMRINTSTKWQLLTLSIIFDMLTYVGKIFFIVGTAGALAISWIPFFGQIGGAAAFGAGNALNFLFTWLFMGVGYTWMWGSLLARDVPIFGGHGLEKKALLFPLIVVADMLPLIGTLMPGITVWTYTQIRFAQQEDMERHARSVEKAKAELAVFQLRMRRRTEQEAYIQQRAQQEAMVAAAANDNQPAVPEAANDNEPRRSTAPLKSNTGQAGYAVPRAA